jgi:hypothetical protein
MADDGPNIEPVCASCGAGVVSGANFCWLCGRKDPLQPVDQAKPGNSIQADKAASKARMDRLRFTFSLSSLMLLTTLVAVCLALIVAFEWLGGALALFLALTATPAYIRTLAIARRRGERGKAPNAWDLGMGFAASWGIAAAAGVASAIAFAGTCTLTVLGGMSLNLEFARSPFDEYALYGFCGAVALVFAVFVLVITWPRRRA